MKVSMKTTLADLATSEVFEKLEPMDALVLLGVMRAAAKHKPAKRFELRNAEYRHTPKTVRDSLKRLAKLGLIEMEYGATDTGAPQRMVVIA